MTLLITGAGGYLGTILTRQLLSRGHDLVLLDRFDWGTQPLVSALIGYRAPAIISGDIRDESTVRAAISGVDAIIHLAAVVGYPACDAAPQDADTTNVEGTRLICRLAEGRPVIFACTGSCYGKIDGLANESTPINPLTRYGRTKAAAERIVIDSGGVSLRLATLFGLSYRMRWDLLVHDFCRHAARREPLHLFEGDASRTFLHVEDAAAAFARFADLPIPGVWNIGASWQNLTKREVAEEVQWVRSFEVIEAEGHDPDARDYAVDYQKVGQLNGWSPTRTLSDALPTILELAAVWR